MLSRTRGLDGREWTSLRSIGTVDTAWLLFLTADAVVVVEVDTASCCSRLGCASKLGCR